MKVIPYFSIILLLNTITSTNASENNPMMEFGLSGIPSHIDPSHVTTLTEWTLLYNLTERLIGGGPTFIGAWIGYLASSNYFYVAFLAIAAGALLYVVNELFNVGRKLSTPPAFAVWHVTQFCRLG